MAHRVDLDAMIPREDFGVMDDSFALDLMSDFPIRHLTRDAPVLRLLRKPDFQRETNHWTPEQVVTLIESFVDSEVIPSLILWKAPSYIFVIDGGHRLSALRAWMEDDYGDKHISRAFYRTDIPKKQLEIAERTRRVIEKRVGRYTDLVAQVDLKTSPPTVNKRAQVLATRALPLQWIQGNAKAAETSFYKINSQGTPLDDTETMLIKNRRGPITIGARAIVRGGSGHKYWSGFSPEYAKEIEEVTAHIYEDVFKPEVDEPIKTLELPIGGSVSPVDALALLIEFLCIAGTRQQGIRAIEQYSDDVDGQGTVSVLKNAYEVLNRMCGKSRGSLGLHPAIYFYNEKGKYSRFLFLAMSSVVQDKLRNNDSLWFKKFTEARSKLEAFLVANKSVLGMLIVNLSKGQRVSRMRDLIEFLVLELRSREVTIEEAISVLGQTGRIVDVRTVQASADITDDTKTAVFFRDAIKNALQCPICGGAMEPKKSVSFDHVERIREGGSGDIENVQMAHPYCNTGYKN
ncbi:MAG TPA: DUF262 domain-containing protein [Bryobacteraceae bacterium]